MTESQFAKFLVKACSPVNRAPVPVVSEGFRRRRAVYAGVT